MNRLIHCPSSNHMAQGALVSRNAFTSCLAPQSNMLYAAARYRGPGSKTGIGLFVWEEPSKRQELA